MSAEPAMKAAHLKTNVALVRALDQGAQILDLVDNGRVREIETAPSSSWLPVEFDIELSMATASVLGLEGAGRWAADCVVDGASRPYLMPFLTGFRHLFGSRIHKFLRLVLPKAFHSIYRACGDLVGEDLGTEFEVRWTDIPDQIAVADGYAYTVGAAIIGCFELVDIEATMQTRVDPEANTARFIYRWER